MLNIDLNARIKHKRDSVINWSTNNPVLLKGECIIVDMDDGSVRIKIGDGINNFISLPYADDDLRNIISEITVIPPGAIILYSGSTIPDGWALCDGNNGTPDLTDRFVIGAGKSYQVNDTGGEAEHTLTIDELPEHSFTLPGDPIINSTANGTVTLGVGGYFTTTKKFKTLNTTDTIGSGVAHNNMPPYYALCYIMKI